MPEDDTISLIIQRDLDQLPLLPADRWVPRELAARDRTQFGRITSAGTLARAMSLGLAITVVAAAAGLGLANWRAQRTAPDESPTAAIGVPGALALAGGAPSLGFGLVSTEVNTLLVRNETTVSAPFSISNALPQVAVSPNGHEIAYWRSVPDRTGGATWELFRADLIDPAARDIGVMTAPAGEVPGSFVWSSDGTGLVVNTHTAVQRGPVAGGSSSAAHSTWFIVDVASRKATELAPAFASVVSTVYAWDRQRDLITGSAFTALGQNAFVTLQSGRVATHALPAGTMIAAADAYGRSVVLARAQDCKGISAATRCPMLEIRDQATFNAFGVWESLNEPAHDMPQVVFRPRSQDLIVQFSLPNGDARVELWSDLGRGARQVLATYTQTARFTGPRELVLPRVDGSAVFSALHHTRRKGSTTHALRDSHRGQSARKRRARSGVRESDGDSTDLAESFAGSTGLRSWTGRRDSGGPAVAGGIDVRVFSDDIRIKGVRHSRRWPGSGNARTRNVPHRRSGERIRLRRYVHHRMGREPVPS